MAFESDYPEKIDALDLIITALKEHEKKMNDLNERLEEIINTLEGSGGSVTEEDEWKAERALALRKPILIYNKWDEFKKRCRGAKVVAFEIEDNAFHVYSIVDGEVLRYFEKLPNKRLRVVDEQTHFSIDKTSLNNIDLLQFLMNRKLRCGLSLLIGSSKTILSEDKFLFEFNYSFDSGEVKSFLSAELDVLREDIVEGKVTY